MLLCTYWTAAMAIYSHLYINDIYWRWGLSESTARIGSIEEFEVNQEGWRSYAKRLGHYILAKDLADPSKKHSVLLSVCGPSTYKLIWRLTSQTSLSELSYSEIVILTFLPREVTANDSNGVWLTNCYTGVYRVKPQPWCRYYDLHYMGSKVF